MIAYIIRRLLLLPVVLFGVTVMIFAMLQTLSPYQRVSAYVSNPTKITTEGLDQLVEEYGLNDPVVDQYFRWLKNIFHGNLGWSQTANMSVAAAIVHFLPATFELTLYTIIPMVLIGIWLGIISAVHHNDPIDHATRMVAITGWSFPTFVFGILSLMVFYGGLRWFPPGRLSTWADVIVHSANFHRYTGMNTVDALLNGNFKVFLDALRHLVLPVITLAYVSWALILRIMRSSMLETLRQDYIVTARAKGLPERSVLKKHARRNALIPTVTVGGLIAMWLMSGVVVVETIFNYRGLGRWVAAAALQLDIPSVLGFALFSSVLMVIGNLIIDVMYAYIDPRVKLG